MVHDVRGESHDRRRWAAGRSLLVPDHACGRRAVHAGHLDVHEDDVPLLPGPGLHDRGAVVHDHRPDAHLGQDGLQDQLVGGVVFRDQHLEVRDRLAGRCFDLGRSPYRWVGDPGERQTHGEGRSLVHDAFGGQLAAHGLCQVGADRQPQSGAAKLAGDR